jgi:hypothetical protein
MPQTEQTTLQALARGTDKPAGDKYTFIVERVRAKVFEIDDSNFNAGSAVMLPISRMPVRADESLPVSALSSIAAALDNASDKLCVMAHAQSVGSPEADRTLTTLRAKNVELYLKGDRDGWAASCEAHQVEDYQHILTWIAFAHGYGCDPRRVGDPLGPSTQRALSAFREAYNHDYGTSLALEGPITVEDWAAFYDLYEEALAQELGVEVPALSGKRGALQFYTPPSLGCGSGWAPAPDQPVRSESADRVDLVFIAEGPLPDFEADVRRGSTAYGAGSVVKLEYQPLEAKLRPLKIKLLDGFREPLADKAFELSVSVDPPLVLEGTTDGSGELQVDVPPAALRGELTLYTNEERTESHRWLLLIGELPAIERDLGLQARLNLLGVHSGAPLGDAGELRSGLLAYQSAREDLEPTGEPDDDTRSTADDEHQQVLA